MNKDINLFNNESEDLEDVLHHAIWFCRAYSYGEFRIKIGEKETEYIAKAVLGSGSGSVTKTKYKLQKPRRVTIEEIEKEFGCPVEIVP